jgi:putative transposase
VAHAPELAAQGLVVCRGRIARLYRKRNLRCIKATTYSNHDLPVADNLLNQTFAPTRLNETWATVTVKLVVAKSDFI